MALIKCMECGKEYSDRASACPNCGCPKPTDEEFGYTGATRTEEKVNVNQETSDTGQKTDNAYPSYGNSAYNQSPIKKTESGMGIAALVLCIIGCLGFVGIILAIIDLVKNDRTKKHTCAKIAIGVFVAWIAIGVVFGSKSDIKKVTTTKAETTTDSSENTDDSKDDSKQPDDETVTVGDTIDDNGVLVTLIDCNDYVSDNEFITPADGKKYVKLDFEIKNTSDDTQNISSYISFSAYADDYSINQSYVTDSAGSLDGEVAAGKNMSGSIFYEIPIDTKTLQVDYISNFWTDRRTSFVINY